MSNELIIKIEANQTNGMRVSELNLDGSNITIDWGDSTIDDYSESIEHEYDEEGEYTITITGVSGIHAGLLYGVGNVVEVIIPNNITTLSNSVFRGCGNLEKVVLPNGISSIGNRFCYDCSNLVEINLPDGLEDIGTYFLSGCGLDEVVFPYGLSTIRTRALLGSNVSNVVIPKSVTSIGDYAFQDCRNLSYIEIPNSVESIGALFGKGSSLTTIKFHSETPPTMGEGLMMGNFDCSFHVPEGSRVNYMNTTGYPTSSTRYVEYPTLKSKLVGLGKILEDKLLDDGIAADWTDGLNTLADDVSRIGEEDILGVGTINTTALDFRNLVNQVNVPSNVTEIGDRSFVWFNITSCTLPNGLTSIGSYAFYHSKLNTLTIPSTVSTIGTYAFGYTNLTTITIPANVQILDYSTFRNCSSLVEVSFASNSSLTTIKDYAFCYCYSLQEIDIPSGVTSIGYRAFWRCNSLQKIKFNSTTPPTLDAEAISDSYWQLPTTCIIEVPQGRLNTYKNATNYPDPSVYTYVESD